MSVIVAIKKDGIVYVGADSQATKGSTRCTLSNPNNYKIWHVKGVPNCIMGCVGAIKDACVLKTINDMVDEMSIIKDAVDYEYVVNEIEPRIKEVLIRRGFISSDDPYGTMESAFLFAYKGSLYTISYGCVLEHDDFVAIGSGERTCMGSLLSSDHIDNPEERIIQAIKASAANDIYVDYPIVIASTDNDEYKLVFDKKEE